MNDSIISLQAKLNKAKSIKNVNNDIHEIQRQLDKLKLQPKIDPNSITDLNRQLDQLLGQKITLSGIEINENQVHKTGQQIGNTIGNNITNGVRQASKEITSEIEKIGDQIGNSQSSSKNLKNILETIRSFALSINAFKTIQNIGKCRISVRISKFFCCFEYALLA